MFFLFSFLSFSRHNKLTDWHKNQNYTVTKSKPTTVWRLEKKRQSSPLGTSTRIKRSLNTEKNSAALFGKSRMNEWKAENTNTHRYTIPLIHLMAFSFFLSFFSVPFFASREWNSITFHSNR
jgi:ABC-type multidrug transport system permease subunit